MKVDLQAEQYKQGISTFILNWILHHSTRTGQPERQCIDEVSNWVRGFCNSLEEGQSQADQRHTTES